MGDRVVVIGRESERVFRSIVVLWTALAIVSCGPSQPTEEASAVVIPLPAHRGGEPCRGIGLSASVEGRPNDPRGVWLRTQSGARRIDVLWPPGYAARFADRLEILDNTGQIVLRGGDVISGGCATGNPDLVALIPPFD